MTPLTPEERNVLVESLQGGGQALVEAVLDLTFAQWTFRPPATPGAAPPWTIAEICEHVELTERHILKRLDTAGADGLAQSQGKDQFIIKAVTSRRTKVPAPEAMLPAGRHASPAAFLEEFRATRTEALRRAQDASLDLRGICATHFALKEMDGYQWLLMTASHTLRHLDQVKEILAHPGFPPTA